MAAEAEPTAELTETPNPQSSPMKTPGLSSSVSTEYK